MRKVSLFTCIVAGLAVTAVSADDLKTVIEKNLEARGGQATIEAVKSARFSGTMSMGGQFEAPFTMEWKRPNQFRMEFQIQGQTGVQAFDGETAWMHMPFMGKSDPEVMPEDQAKEVVERADLIDGPFLNSEAKGYVVELVGTEDVDGTEAFKVKVTRKSGDFDFHFLDSEYYLTIKEASQRKIGEVEQEFETTVGDYKEIGGILFPHYLEVKAKNAPAGQTITINKIELDIDIEDTRFKMPAVEKETPKEGDQD